MKEKASNYAERNASKLIADAIAQAYADGYQDGYKDCEENKPAAQDNDTVFVDLGLPSGTLCANNFMRDEEGDILYMPYQKAKGLSIPTIEQWEELKEHCSFIGPYDGNMRIGHFVCIGPNGNYIIFSFTGYINDPSRHNIKDSIEAYFWTCGEPYNNVNLYGEEEKPKIPSNINT